MVPLLRADVRLNAVTLLEELQRRYPGQWGQSVLRTLQRRIRLWRTQFGAEREVYFAQEHPPGRMGLSDFTVADELQVEIGGAPFPHRLYQFALAHSGWRHATVVTTGESFIALSTGLQAALWALGGVPEEHRTDSLSAAFNNLAEQEELTQRYTDLCRHYGLRASRCNPGQSNENGSIESRHDSLKTALDQALRLRASRCFDSQSDYETFVATIVQRFNSRAAKFMVAERPMLKPLPVRRTAEFEELPARVSKYAIFTIKGVLYSAPSQLIGHEPPLITLHELIGAITHDFSFHGGPQETQTAGDDLRQTVDELDDERHAENLSYGLPHMFCPDDAFHLREAHAQELQDRARYWDRALAIEHTGWTEAELKSRRNQGRLLELSAPATMTTPHRKAYPAEQFMPEFDTELFRLLNWLASRSCSKWATHQFLSGWTTQNKQGEVINGWSVLGLPDAPVDHEPLTDPVFTGVGNRPALMRPVYAPHTPKIALVDAFEAFAAQRRLDYEQRDEI